MRTEYAYLECQAYDSAQSPRWAILKSGTLHRRTWKPLPAAATRTTVDRFGQGLSEPFIRVIKEAWDPLIASIDGWSYATDYVRLTSARNSLRPLTISPLTLAIHPLLSAHKSTHLLNADFAMSSHSSTSRDNTSASPGPLLSFNSLAHMSGVLDAMPSWTEAGKKARSMFTRYAIGRDIPPALTL